MKKAALRKQKEISVEDHLIKRCEEYGGFCLKMNPNWYKGVPDRLCVIPGAMFFVETKRPVGGRVSRIQTWWRNRCRKLKAPHYIFSSKEEIDDFFAEYDAHGLKL